MLKKIFDISDAYTNCNTKKTVATILHICDKCVEKKRRLCYTYCTQTEKETQNCGICATIATCVEKKTRPYFIFLLHEKFATFIVIYYISTRNLRMYLL